MGAWMERSEPVRGATRDDLDHVVELLVRRNREASGVAGTREELVRAEWELPSFEIGARQLALRQFGLRGRVAEGRADAHRLRRLERRRPARASHCTGARARAREARAPPPARGRRPYAADRPSPIR